MKKFALISLIALSLAACNDPLVDVVDHDTAADDRHWSYDLTTSYSDENVANYSTDSWCSADCLSYPDSAFTISLGTLFGSAPSDLAGKFTVETDGQFSAAFTRESLGYTDSVFVDGFLSADTIYFSYSYVNQETGDVGYADAWSH